MSKQTKENLMLFAALAAFWWFVASKAQANQGGGVSDPGAFGMSPSDSWN